MSFLVETGAGTPNATSYMTPTFVTAYLTDQGRETENSWSSKTTAEQEEACMVATRYLDSRWGRRFKGSKLRKAITGRSAKGTITFSGVPVDTETIVIGQKTYRFVSALAQENDVLIGATAAECAENLYDALRLSSDALDVTVDEDTLLNYEVVPSLDGAVVTVTAAIHGVNGNEIVLTNALTNVTVTGSGTLTGGLDTGSQPLEFPRSGLYDRAGTLVQGIPLKLKQSGAEYAVRSLAATLAPDPSIDDTGARVKRSRKVLAVMQSDTTFVDGAVPQIFRPYPEADALLDEYVTSLGTYR